MGMGLGKSVTTLAIIKEADLPTLIVAPKTIAETVWIQEAKKWDELKDLDIQLCTGSPTERFKIINKKPKILVIGVDSFAWLVDVLPVWPFKMIVLDESSRWKDPSTKRFKAMKQVVRLFEKKVILTGTPTPNGIQDIWAQVAILDLGDRLGKSLTAFRNIYLYPASSKGHIVYKWAAKPGSDKIIQDKIKDICFSLKAEDYLTMPKVQYVDHHIQWTDKATYNTMKKDMVVELGENVITAPTAATLTNKLLQITGGHAYVEEEVLELHKDKANFLNEMMEDNDTPTIIFYHYKKSLQYLKNLFPTAISDITPSVINDWQKGKIKMLLLHPQSAGLGLNLQNNTADLAQVIWYDLPWSSELYLQSNARIFRQGQEKPVIIHHLMMESSIDQKVLLVLQGKITLQEALLGALSG